MGNSAIVGYGGSPVSGLASWDLFFVGLNRGPAWGERVYGRMTGGDAAAWRFWR